VTTVFRDNCISWQLYFVTTVFRDNCILWQLYFVTTVFRDNCISWQLYFVTTVFRDNCISWQLYFVTTVFCDNCISWQLYFVTTVFRDNCIQKQPRFFKFSNAFSPHIHAVMHLDIIKVFYSPTDAQVNCLKNNFKIYNKTDILFSKSYCHGTWHNVFYYRPNYICSHITELTTPMYFNWLF
jgi:hypothetical protein